MKFVALIPARGGSKGIPRKNLLKLNNKPLLQWTVEAAKKSGEFEKIIVSTDDAEIANVAESLQVEVSYPRPENLSGDTSLSFDVIKYEMLKLIKKDSSFTHYVLLQTTCPLRTYQDIQESLKIYKNANFRSLISVMNADQYHPSTLYQVETDAGQLLKIENDNQTPEQELKGTLRQNFSNIMWRNGAIYIASISDLERTKILLNQPLGFYEMPWYRSINIDSLENVVQARVILESTAVLEGDVN